MEGVRGRRPLGKCSGPSGSGRSQASGDCGRHPSPPAPSRAPRPILQGPRCGVGVNEATSSKWQSQVSGSWAEATEQPDESPVPQSPARPLLALNTQGLGMVEATLLLLGRWRLMALPPHGVDAARGLCRRYSPLTWWAAWSPQLRQDPRGQGLTSRSHFLGKESSRPSQMAGRGVWDLLQRQERRGHLDFLLTPKAA